MSFVGKTQSTKSGVRLTKVKFEQITSTGKVRGVGKAEVFTLGKGKSAISVTAGRVASKAGAKPSNFVGVEGAVSTAQKNQIRVQLLDVLKAGKPVGTLQVQQALKGIKASTSFSGGSIIIQTTKTGIKFPSGTFVKDVRFTAQQFSAVSKVLTKGQMNVISGGALTNSRDKIQFAGIVRELGKTASGSTKSFSVGGGAVKAKQYQQSLNKLMGTIATATAEVTKVAPRLSQIAATTVAAKVVADTIKTTPITTQQITKLKTATTQKQATKAVSLVANVLSESQIVATATKVATAPSTSTATSAIVAQIANTKTLIKQATTPSTAYNLIQRLNGLIANLAIAIAIPKFGLPFFIAALPFRLRGKIKGKLSKKIAWNSFSKSKGKMIKLNKNPLSKKGAKNRMAYIVDNSTAVTGKIKATKKPKKLGTITSKERGAFRKANLRNYKIVRGKRVKLKNTYIERKGKARINTRGEKRGLSAARVLKGLKKPIKRKKRKVKKKK